MKIMQVEKTLVSTNRVREMGHRPLLVVKEKSGSASVAWTRWAASGRLGDLRGQLRRP